jgi:transposase-like protein
LFVLDSPGDLSIIPTMAKKKKGKRGVRYTDKEKAEIVQFVQEHDEKNGRGGQSTAAAKFGVSALTISNWLKQAGKKAPPKKAPRKKTAAKKKAVRYSDLDKAEIVQYVQDYNQKNGRGGQAAASKKYGVSALSIANWSKKAGKPTKAKEKAIRKPSPARESIDKGGSTQVTLKRMIAIQEQLEALRAEYEGLRGQL